MSLYHTTFDNSKRFLKFSLSFVWTGVLCDYILILSSLPHILFVIQSISISVILLYVQTSGKYFSFSLNIFLQLILSVMFSDLVWTHLLQFDVGVNKFAYRTTERLIVTELINTVTTLRQKKFQNHINKINSYLISFYLIERRFHLYTIFI